MKFSFSTLACPDYTWADIYSMAKDLGFDGIEVRGVFFDPVNSLVSGSMTEDDWIASVKSASEQMRVNLQS